MSRILIFETAGGGFPSRPLDSYTTGLWSCGGIKQLIGSYVGPLIKVRRSSDSTQQDINYLSDGSLDTTALATFVGSGDGWVTIAYDQSGNGNNFAAGASGTEPRIVSAGTYDATLVMNATGTTTTFGSVNTFPGASTGGSFFAAFTVRAFVGDDPIFIASPVATSGNNGIAFQNSTSDSLLSAYYFNGVPSGTNYWHKRYNRSTLATGYQFGFVVDNTAATAALYQDGGIASVHDSLSTTITTNFTAATIYLGNSPSSPNQSKFNALNFAVYHVAVGSSDAQAITGLLG